MGKETKKQQKKQQKKLYFFPTRQINIRNVIFGNIGWKMLKDVQLNWRWNAIRCCSASTFIHTIHTIDACIHFQIKQMFKLKTEQNLQEDFLFSNHLKLKRNERVKLLLDGTVMPVKTIKDTSKVSIFLFILFKNYWPY